MARDGLVWLESALADYRSLPELARIQINTRIEELLERPRQPRDHDPVFITRRGRRVAAVIAAEDLDRLIAAAEDLADIRAARVVREEIAEGERPVPWAEVEICR